MVAVEIDNCKYSIRFHYRRGEEYGRKVLALDSKVPLETTCEIKAFSNDTKAYEPISKGTVKHHKPDKLCKQHGRKLALTKALQLSGLDKRYRGLIWDNYFATHTDYR